MVKNNKFVDEMANVVNQICESVEKEPLANAIILSASNPTEDMKAGFEILASMVSIQSGRKLKAQVEKPTDDYVDGDIHLAYINDGTNTLTLGDLFKK